MSVLRKLLATTNEPLILALRLALGVVMFPHGAQKLLGWFGGGGVSGTMGFMNGNMGLPALIVWLVIISEFFGSLGLIFGFLGRIAGLGIAAVMAGAIFTVNLAGGFFWTAGGWEYPFLLLLLSLFIVWKGSGPLSVDQAILRQSGEANAPAASTRATTR